MKNLKESGITLIALIITIIVLLILAGVSISLVVGDNGILGQAINATTATDIADVKEQIELAVIGYLDTNGDYTLVDVEQAVSDTGATLSGTTVTTSKGNEFDISDLVKNASDYVEPISTDESFVGYYADVDGDGDIDGIIYVDLMHEQTAEYWSPGSTSSTYITYGTYSWETITSSKDYYISEYNYEDDFGTADVIAPVNGSKGNDRFYVMALEDFATNDYITFYWYYNANGDPGIDYYHNTFTDFGAGKINTETMIGAYNDEKFGLQLNKDIWKEIQTKNEEGYSIVDYGWFVPSSGEWAAFCSEMSIDKSNYSDYFNSNYYSSSWCGSSKAYGVNFFGGYIHYYSTMSTYFDMYVRLSTTF